MNINRIFFLATVAAFAIRPLAGLAQEPTPADAYYGQHGAPMPEAAVDYGPSPAPYNPCPAEDTCCWDGCCGGCAACCRSRDLFGSIEYLMWWGKGSKVPALVTTNDPGSVTFDDAGEFPDADVLVGREHMGNELQNGGRVLVGVWLDPEHNVGAALRFYATDGDTDNFFFSSDDEPILARPFFDVVNDEQEAVVVAFPTVSTGDVSVRYASENFIGTEAYLEVMMERNCNARVDVIAGYQFVRLDDRLVIESNTTIIEVAGPLPPGTTFNITDQFRTLNEFHGMQLGFRGQMMRGCASLEALAKVGVGMNFQTVEINGSTTTTIPPGPGAIDAGGVLAQPSNIGLFERDRFAYIPELTLNLHYHVSPNMSFHIGYTMIYFSDVVTSGGSIDTGVDVTQVEDRPAFEFRDEYYWLQGINFGANWDY